MSSKPQISDAEWAVMKELWDESPQTSSEIIGRLKDKTKWNPKTIHTLIRRLVEKGAVLAEKEGAYYRYRPSVSESECKRAETKTFLKKVYDGSFNMLVASFVKEEKLSMEEIEELKQLLDDMKTR